jgi:TRAP-type mannitol/chloroaromatic compound transport system permease small subunit
MKALVALAKAIDGINLYTGRLVAWIIVVLMGLSVFEVVTRRIFGAPTIWTHEVLSYVFAAHLMLALGYTLLRREHVSVDILTERLSERAQAVLEIITFVVFLGLFLWVMLPEAVAFAQRSWTFGERAASAFASPVYPAKTLIPIGFALLALEAIGTVLKDVIFLLWGHKV